MTRVTRDDRTRRDKHALDEHGMVLCNPRDREAAHRAEMEGIATHDAAAVTCRKCLTLLHRGETPGPALFRRVRRAPPVAAEPGPGDGVDPREERRAKLREDSRGKTDHARVRLAAQIFEALNQGGVLGAAGLDDFRFAAVKPSGDSGPFLVEVCGVDPLARYEPAAIEAVLREHKGLLRAEVAQSVNRRQAPELRFLVLPPGAQP